MSSSLVRAGSGLLSLQKAALAAPWHCVLFLLTRVSWLLLTFLTALGAAPPGLASREKVRRLETMVEALQDSVQAERQRRQDAQDEVQRQRVLKAKAIKKMQRARQQCEEQQRDAEDVHVDPSASEVPFRPGPTFRKTEPLTHFVLCAAVFFTIAFYKTLPSLQKKLLGALLTPIVAVYFLVPSYKRHSAPTVLIQLMSSGVLGFLLQRFLSRSC